MERIALIMNEGVIYWSSVIMTLAVAAAICGFLALYLGSGGSVAAAAVCVPVTVLLSLVCARTVHWYFCSSGYAGFSQAIQDFSGGGFALAGAAAGCFAAAAVLRLLGISRDLPGMLDCMSIAGCGGIAVGRLSSGFNTGGRGFLTQPGEMPWIVATANAVSGAVEYRFATFLVQAMAAGVICACLLLFRLVSGKKKAYRQGDACLLFLLLYGASQVLLDSTRYDAMYFRSNGFVSVAQVLGALGIGVAAVVFSLRLVKLQWKPWYLLLWMTAAALLGAGGYMEYYVQRHGSETVFAYSVMGGCLAGAVVLVLVLRAMAVREEERQRINMAWLKQDGK